MSNTKPGRLTQLSLFHLLSLTGETESQKRLKPYLKENFAPKIQVKITAYYYFLKFLAFSRNEHKKHCPSCLFVKTGKKDADLTVYEYLNLSFERKKNIMVCILCLLCA
jgi:hypothetical protein